MLGHPSSSQQLSAARSKESGCNVHRFHRCSRGSCGRRLLPVVNTINQQIGLAAADADNRPTSAPPASANHAISGEVEEPSTSSSSNGHTHTAAKSSHSSEPTQSWDEDVDASTKEADKPAKPKGGGLAMRVTFGVLMGVAGGSAVLVKPLFLLAAMFITYAATIEYYSMVTSKGITKGMAPPPPLVSSLTAVLCVSMVAWGYFSRGKSGTVLAVAAFFLLVMNLVAIRKPKFSMLASTLFGVFYCGGWEWPHGRHGLESGEVPVEGLSQLWPTLRPDFIV